MEDYHEIIIKNVCCTCLSTERNLSQLCRIDDAVNEMFFLLSYKTEADEATFIKDVTQLFICWECIALMQRFSKFREQVCLAHSKLTDIIDGKVNYSNIKTLSKLTICNKFGYDQVFDIKVEEVEDPETFVDCGPDNMDIKFHSDTDDIPLAQLSHLKTEGDEDNIEKITVNSPDTKDGGKKNKRKAKNKDIPCIDKVEVNDYDNNISERDSTDDFDESEIRKPKSYKRKKIKTYVPLPIAKYGNSYIYQSKNMLNKTNIGCTVRKSKILETKVKRVSEVINDNSTIDFEIVLDTEIGKTIIEKKEIGNKVFKRKVKNKNVLSNVNIPISNGDNKYITSKGEVNDEKNEDSTNNVLFNYLKVTKNEICMNLIQMNKVEMRRSIEARKSKDDYVNAMNKCEECIEIFEDCDSLEKHITELHEQRPNTKMCIICKVYVKLESLNSHYKEHYLEWKCQICKESLPYKYRCLENVQNHLKSKHYMQDSYINAQMNKLTEQEKIVNYQEQPLTVLIDDAKGAGFLCLQCRQYFRSKNLRNQHVQRCHSEGFQCPTCGKKFPLKETLRKHETIHCNPRPRQECKVCGKMVRADLMKVHSLYHSNGKHYSCVPCNKKFKSSLCYYAHLKYTKQHADKEALKYKCSICDKGYRSPAELRDHQNYWHEAKTIHKCPICHTALATPRSVALHIKRAHEGKNKTRNKICQTCGKAFTNQRMLTEHEWIHTGERPISCDICARAFRQKAGLYTHKRLVHKVPLKKKIIHHADDINAVKDSEINKIKD